jgi:hypothetical protein
MTGFRTYWPNGSLSECYRTSTGLCTAHNIAFEEDGSINFMVGKFAASPGSFSPCVEAGMEPLYALVPQTDKRPYWPAQPKAYRL